MAGRRKTRGKSKRKGTRTVLARITFVGGSAGGTRRRRKAAPKRRRASAKKSKRVVSKSGRVYSRTKGGRLKMVASRIGGRQHRKAKKGKGRAWR